jgi:hypothetical protein
VPGAPDRTGELGRDQRIAKGHWHQTGGPRCSEMGPSRQCSTRRACRVVPFDATCPGPPPDPDAGRINPRLHPGTDVPTGG